MTGSLYNLSTKTKKFDRFIIRTDIFGNIVIKNIPYVNNFDNSCFAFDIVKQNSKTYIVNSIVKQKMSSQSLSIQDILQKGIQEEYKIMYPEKLLNELNYNLHETCKKFNLYFNKTNKGYWTILKDKNKNYRQYKDEYIVNYCNPDVIKNNESQVFISNIANKVVYFINDTISFFHKKTYKDKENTQEVKTISILKHDYINKILLISTNLAITSTAIGIAYIVNRKEKI